MKIFELLSGETQSPENPASATAPMVNPSSAMTTPTVGTPTAGTPNAGTPTPNAPMKTAGLGSMIGDFFSTPHPIGGTQAPTPPTPTTTPSGQPVQTPGSIFGQRMFGNTAVGQTLDKINTGLQPPKQ